MGVSRRDPMAMKPFCGYNFADYWGYWLSYADKSKKLPKIFHVNWFRQDQNGHFIWPGFGENLRVLTWILGRCHGEAQAVATPIGNLPRPQDLDSQGLNLDAAALASLLSVDRKQWRAEMQDVARYFKEFGKRVPKALWDEQQQIATALERNGPDSDATG